jgi:hypothetical protein
MSIYDRLVDAKLLGSQQRWEGALLNALVAVAATSRRRYPKPKGSNYPTDNEAFTDFLGEEMYVVFEGAVRDCIVADLAEWSEVDKPKISLQLFFYKYVRCCLAHEAKLHDTVEFIDGEPNTRRIHVDPNEKRVRFNWPFIDGLFNTVIYAPENADLFPKEAEMPPDVLAWTLFNKRRDHAHTVEYMEKCAERVLKLEADAQ